MSTDSGSAAAPEDSATRAVSSERPGLESGDPESADSATSTPETSDRGTEGAADPDGSERDGSGRDDDADHSVDDADDDSHDADDSDDDSDDDAADDDDDAEDDPDEGPERDSGGRGGDPTDEGFVSGMLRDATITGLPGETGPPPAEPHAPQAQQQGDEPVGSEPPAGDDAR